MRRQPIENVWSPDARIVTEFAIIIATDLDFVASTPESIRIVVTTGSTMRRGMHRAIR